MKNIYSLLAIQRDETRLNGTWENSTASTGKKQKKIFSNI
jgi:hypothetical protein